MHARPHASKWAGPKLLQIIEGDCISEVGVCPGSETQYPSNHASNHGLKHSEASPTTIWHSLKQNDRGKETRGREAERQRDRGTETQRHTDRSTHTHTHTYTHTYTHAHTHTDRQTHTHRNTHRNTHTKTHTDTHTYTHTWLKSYAWPWAHHVARSAKRHQRA
jgi:hypothetical protein